MASLPPPAAAIIRSMAEHLASYAPLTEDERVITLTAVTERDDGTRHYHEVHPNTALISGQITIGQLLHEAGDRLDEARRMLSS